MHTSTYGRQQSAGYSSVCVPAGEDNARLLTSGLSHLSLVHMHNIHPGANMHPGCIFAPGVYFGHVNGAL